MWTIRAPRRSVIMSQSDAITNRNALDAAVGAECSSSQPAAARLAVSQATSLPADGKPPCFVIMHSVSKKHNVGTIARCATAFGVQEVCMLTFSHAVTSIHQYECPHLVQVCLVGSRQFNTFGSHGSDAYVDFGQVKSP